MKIKMFMLVLVCVTVTVSCTYLAITATVKHTDFKMLNINDGVVAGRDAVTVMKPVS